MTRFEIGDDYAAKFDVQTVGTRGRHDELWVPAGELGEFNRQILGKIEVVASFVGPDFRGQINEKTHLPTFS